MFSLKATRWQGPQRLAPSSITLALAGCLLGAALPNGSMAQEERQVELRALDGSAVVKGELVEVRDDAYLINTDLGILQIDVNDAECIGPACPTLGRFDEKFTIEAPADQIGALVLPLMRLYAESLEADMRIEDGAQGSRSVSLVDEETGAPLADIDIRADDAAPPGQSPEEAGAEDPPVLRLFHDQGLRSDPVDANDRILAYDGLALIVHPDNPVDTLDRATIAELFSCERTSWGDIGGPEGPVRLHARDHGSSTLDPFRRMILEPAGVELCASTRLSESNAEIDEIVADDVNAIGLLSLQERYDAKPITLQECKEHTFRPSFFSIKSGNYPLAQRIVVKEPVKNTSPALQKFLDFALGDAGQTGLQKIGRVNLSIEKSNEILPNYRLYRLAAAAKSRQENQQVIRFADEIQNAVRLSSTFRFRTSSNELNEQNALDNQALRDLKRLADHLLENVDDWQSVMVLGFSDISGNYQNNLALSEQRARTVADKLASLGVTVSGTAGFGEEAPVACNDNLIGRSKNRRVEVWLRS